MKIRQRILNQKKYLLIQINVNKLGTNTDVKVFCLLVRVQELILSKIVDLGQMVVVDRLVVVVDRLVLVGLGFYLGGVEVRVYLYKV